MFCNDCGKPLEQGAIFCPECGSKTDDTHSQPISQSSVPQGNQLPTGYGAASKSPPVSFDMPTYAAEGATPVVVEPPMKKRPIRFILVTLAAVIIVAGALIGIPLIQKNAAIQKDVEAYEIAMTQAEELSEEVEGLFSDKYEGFPAEGKTLEDVDKLQARLKEIKRNPDEKYAKEVKEKVKVSEHKLQLDALEKKLKDAAERITALEEVNTLFETAPIKNGDYTDTLALAVGNDAAVNAALEKYLYLETEDNFWTVLADVVNEAYSELMWAENTIISIEELEAQDSFTQLDFDNAQDNVDYLYDGGRKAELQARLDTLLDRIEAEPVQADLEPEPEDKIPEPPISEGDAFNSIVYPDNYDNLEDFVNNNQDLFQLDKINESLAGMMEVSVFAQGNTMTLRMTYSSMFDSFAGDMKNALETMMDDMDANFLPMTESIQAIFPDADIVLEICKSDGTIILSRSY